MNKEEEKPYEYLSDKYNFSKSQTGLLYELCDNDLDVLETLLSTYNSNWWKYTLPGTKEELSKIPKIGDRIKHILSGHVGTICNKMNSYNPPQWGCSWDNGEQITRLGLAYYWNDKTLIEKL